MIQSHDVVAALFGADQQAITQYLVKVPTGMDDDALVDQVLALARVEGVIRHSHGRITVAIRPADPIEDADLYEDDDQPTVH